MTFEFSSVVKTPPTVLIFAASDPTGGAGVQADIMTVSSLGCHPITVLTALTTQNTYGVEGIFAVDEHIVNAQARMVLEDVSISAIKLGVLGSVEAVNVIHKILLDYPKIPVVWDPVLMSGRGDTLTSNEVWDCMCDLLLPKVRLVTPNSHEMLHLAFDEEPPEDYEDWPEAARYILGSGCEFLLLTGTHMRTPQVHNYLYDKKGLINKSSWERLPGSYHGSGCTLSSAIAAGLALGWDMKRAVMEAQNVTWKSLKYGFRLGMGQFIPDRFYALRTPLPVDVH
jgi:hydroxymethylpyrimidine/phosphomethylpyrimidine kinase